MAKRRRAVNKSQKIRDALAANPDKSPAEISALLKAEGLKVKPQYVSTIKANANRKSARGDAGAGSSFEPQRHVVQGPTQAWGFWAPPSLSSVLPVALPKAALASIEEIRALTR